MLNWPSFNQSVARFTELVSRTLAAGPQHHWLLCQYPGNRQFSVSKQSMPRPLVWPQHHQLLCQCPNNQRMGGVQTWGSMVLTFEEGVRWKQPPWKHLLQFYKYISFDVLPIFGLFFFILRSVFPAGEIHWLLLSLKLKVRENAKYWVGNRTWTEGKSSVRILVS